MDTKNAMVAMNQSPFYQQFHWQLMPQQLGNAAAPSPAVVMYLFPQTIGIRGPDEELPERNLKRQIRNRESAARSIAKKLVSLIFSLLFFPLLFISKYIFIFSYLG
jgi:hypothetical protein